MGGNGIVWVGGVKRRLCWWWGESDMSLEYCIELRMCEKIVISNMKTPKTPKKQQQHYKNHNSH